MKKTVKHYLDDILESINKDENYLEDKTQKDFLNDDLLQDSIVHRIQVIGEVPKRIPDSYKDLYPEVPWRSITGIRDKIVHDYDSVDLYIIWDVAENFIPELKPHITAMLEKTDNHEFEF